MLPDAEDAIRVAGCNGDIFVRMLEDRRISHSIKVMDGYPVAGTRPGRYRTTVMLACMTVAPPAAPAEWAARCGQILQPTRLPGDENR
jgi:hypothetical protein